MDSFEGDSKVLCNENNSCDSPINNEDDETSNSEEFTSHAPAATTVRSNKRKYLSFDFDKEMGHSKNNAYTRSKRKEEKKCKFGETKECRNIIQDKRGDAHACITIDPLRNDYRKLEEKLLIWIKDIKSEDTTFKIKGPDLKKKAEEFANELGITDMIEWFPDWFQQFKSRNSQFVNENVKTPRTVRTLTLEKKAQLIADVDKGDKSKRELAEIYGISPSTISGIMPNRVKIMEAFHSQSFKPERKKFRKSSFENLEKELLEWVILWQSTNEPFNGPKLMEKAKEIAQKLEITEFVGSNGWIDRFKKRNNINFIPGCEVNKVFKEHRKINTLTLEKKVELLKEVDKGEFSKRQIAEEFGIAPSTLSGIIVNRVRIMEAYHSKSFGPGRQKFRRCAFQNIEDELLKWVEETRKHNTQIKNKQLLEKAQDIAKEKGIDNFAGSYSWVERFKARNSQTFLSPVEEDIRNILPGMVEMASNGQDSYQSDNHESDDSATPDTTDFSGSECSEVTKQASDAFQNIFKKHKCRDQYRKYTQEQLMEACKYAIESKASYREVSDKFGVPQSTLRDKLHAVERLNTDSGPPSSKKVRIDDTEPISSDPNLIVSPETSDIEPDSERTNGGMSNDRSNYRQYSKDSLTTAAHYVMKFNTPIMKAARMFGVPASTLKDHVRNKMSNNIEPESSSSVPSLISDRDERKLLEYIKMMEKCGFMLTKNDIIDFGSELASSSQEIEGSITLSDSWFDDFVRRWPPIGILNRERRNPVPHDIKKYFTELNKIFNKHKFFERPELVYVIDDVDINLEYNPLKLTPKKQYDKSKSARNTQQTLTTVVGCSNALGTALPPYFALQSDEIVSDVIAQSPPGTQASFVNSGSKDCSVLRDYFQNHFMRFAQSGRNTQNRFVLVFYDSRKTNFNVSDLEWAKRWHILLFPLPHDIKTADSEEKEEITGIFRNYGNDLEEVRCNFVNKNGYMAVSMPDICGILGKAYRKSLTYEHVISCFDNWGIYPLNPKNYVSKLDAVFQVKLQDLKALPNYETNLWLLSDFGCTQAVNNAIESSLNSSYTNDGNVRRSSYSTENDFGISSYSNENSLATDNYRRQSTTITSSHYNGSVQTNPIYGGDSRSFNESYQGFMNHLMGQAVQDNYSAQQRFVNGVAIKSEPEMDVSYGNISSDKNSVLQNGLNQSQNVLERSLSSASEESQNNVNSQLVTELTGNQIPTSFSSSVSHTSSSYSAQGYTSSNDDVSNSSQIIAHVKNKCESSSSSRRKGKSYRVIVNEPEPEESPPDTPSSESNVIFSKSKPDSRRTGKLGSLLDEKVRKLYEQAKASNESVEDSDEPLMKVGEFEIVMNKGD